MLIRLTICLCKLRHVCSLLCQKLGEFLFREHGATVLGDEAIICEIRLKKKLFG
jgi:hypothetical protein